MYSTNAQEMMKMISMAMHVFYKLTMLINIYTYQDTHPYGLQLGHRMRPYSSTHNKT